MLLQALLSLYTFCKMFEIVLPGEGVILLEFQKAIHFHHLFHMLFYRHNFWEWCSGDLLSSLQCGPVFRRLTNKNIFSQIIYNVSTFVPWGCLVQMKTGGD